MRPPEPKPPSWTAGAEFDFFPDPLLSAPMPRRPAKRFPLLAAILVATLPTLAIAQGPPPAKVAVETAVWETVRETAMLIGSVEAFQGSTVASLTEGRVLALKVRTGDRVDAGAPLAALDTTQSEIERDRARARQESARVRLAQAEADLALGEKLLPEQAITSDVVAARGRTANETRHDLAEQDAEIARLTYQIDQATIRAPFPGVVSQELVQAGEWVPLGGGIVRLVDLSVARVKVWVPEHIVGQLAVGDDVTVDTAGGVVQGTLHAVIPDGDTKSRTFPVETRVDNTGGKLLPGMLARVTFGVGPEEKALTVPRDALVTRGTSSHLWKVVEGSAVRVPVTPGREKGDRVEVTPMGELGPGDTVITRGNERVRDGQTVQVQ